MKIKSVEIKQSEELITIEVNDKVKEGLQTFFNILGEVPAVQKYMDKKNLEKPIINNTMTFQTKFFEKLSMYNDKYKIIPTIKK